ncbi:3-phosphoshikimate 1-carboxyvinyltransferase [Bythopirellula polymerisocia]|uniref:3-phosphoshikimate 1-carboxyvinyltransferase n=1 Tax=Bythopirellula polymerisocia TaxID=2528003 RepID=A0A5C6CRV0_9BACT|nr:3-phosphoshikimate 1-carboxyvinyltransferase [Bythopirellula polymerisocia]TWU27280.1 3-phosphoshikimate 1-carboxyvinyltransferase [Bythopirellula polymerisocia]
MPDEIEIQPVKKPVVGEIRPPGSKSITNRALICAALAEGKSELQGALDSEDTQVMIDGLRALGISVNVADSGQTLQVVGCGGNLPAKAAEIFVGNSGTTIRFLTAAVTLGQGKFRLDGVERMRERPIGDLASALNQLGADVRCERDGGCPPVKVAARGLQGGVATVRGDISSQFLSGLLMAAPCAEEDVILRVAGKLVSIPYVRMTLRVMESFGVKTQFASDFCEIQIPSQGRYQACRYAIEPDASAASYFWAVAAVTGGKVTVRGLNSQSLQGDVAFVKCLQSMGCQIEYQEDAITVQGGPLSGIDVDMNAISDTVQTLAVVALFAKGTTRIRNIAHIRHKETDRIAALATELRKLGAKVAEYPGGLDIIPGEVLPATIDTYNDHRMAMSFAVAGIKARGVVIRDPDCTAKTYPKFFTELGSLTNDRQNSGHGANLH